MTNTSPITTTNFIAGVMGVSLALVIMPNIIVGTVSASADGTNRDAASDLVSDINSVCGGSDEVSGDLGMDSNYKLELDYENLTMYDSQDNEIKHSIVACRVDAKTVLESGGEYVIQSTDVDEDDDHENYDIEMQ